MIIGDPIGFDLSFAMHQEARGVFEFGPYRLDGRDGSLTAEGRKILLPPKAIDVLLMLVEDAGGVVSKERLADRVWAGTTVEPASVNFQIFLIRRALRDRLGDQPCIDTVAKRGFRFVAPVRRVPESPDGRAMDLRQGPTERPEPPPPPQRWKWAYVAIAVAVIGLPVGGIALSVPPSKSLVVVGYTALTHDREPKSFWPPLLSDGEHVYYKELMTPVFNSVPEEGGQTLPVIQTTSHFTLLDASRAGSGFLAARSVGPTAPDYEVWTLPSATGSPNRVGDLLCADATWSPDGREIACSAGEELYVVRSDGTGKRRLPTPPGGRARYPRWSPSSRVVRFSFETVGDREIPEEALWEVQVDGTGLRPLLPGWNHPATECCGGWTPDGDWFVFQSARDGRTDLWALRERRSWLDRGAEAPIHLTVGPLSFQGLSMGPDGKTVFAIGKDEEGELAQYDVKRGEFVRYLPGLSGIWLAFSPDRKWIAYSGYPDAHLWRARSDGTERQQLTFGPFSTDGAAWSPDGKWIAFRSRMDGKHLKIYLMPAAGGEPHPIIAADEEQGIPSWSPDSQRVAFSDVPAVFGHAKGEEVLHIYDVARKEFSIVPGSPGLRLWACRWSPDGRYLSALTIDGQQLELYDFAAATWRSLPASQISNQTWSHDGRFIYYDTEGSTHILRRVRISDGHVDDLVDLQHVPVAAYWWSGLTPDDSPLILRNLGETEVYALHLDVR